MSKNTVNAVLGVTLVVAALSLALSACSSVKRELGVGRNSPDEFMVIKRAPLTVPPDYILRPPAAAAAPSLPSETAQTALLGKSETPVVQNSSDKIILDKLGAAKARTDIREKIEEDNGYISFKNRTLAARLIFWDDEKITSPENIPVSVVNPTAEAARIKKNREEGKPITGDNAPVIEKKKSTFDKLF